MTKRERVFAALERRPVDRPPISFWRHVPELDHDPRLLAEAMLGFHRRLDLDFVKLMSSGVYCVEDWGCTVAYMGAPSGAKQCTEHAVRKTAGGALRRASRAADPRARALPVPLHAAAHPRARHLLRRAGGAACPRGELARSADAADAGRGTGPAARGRDGRRAQRGRDAPPWA